jgi:hypothetical protein
MARFLGRLLAGIHGPRRGSVAPCLLLRDGTVLCTSRTSTDTEDHIKDPEPQLHRSFIRQRPGAYVLAQAVAMEPLYSCSFGVSMSVACANGWRKSSARGCGGEVLRILRRRERSG